MRQEVCTICSYILILRPEKVRLEGCEIIIEGTLGHTLAALVDGSNSVC